MRDLSGTDLAIVAVTVIVVIYIAQAGWCHVDAKEVVMAAVTTFGGFLGGYGYHAAKGPPSLPEHAQPPHAPIITQGE